MHYEVSNPSGKTAFEPSVPASGAVARVDVAIGDVAVSDDPAAVLTARCLGSGVAVVLWDPQARIGAVGRWLLPCSTGQEAVEGRPALFADRGFAELRRSFTRSGGDPARALGYIAGGADPKSLQPLLRLGERNTATTERLLADAGIRVSAAWTKGTANRTVELSLANGTVEVSAPVPRSAPQGEPR